MRKFWISVTILIILSAPAVVLVPSGHGAKFRTWSDLTTIYYFTDKWRYDGDQGIRGVLTDSNNKLLYFRPSLRYWVKPWLTLHGGIRFFKVFSDNISDTFEIGPWQGLRFSWPKIGKYRFSHYFRLEERWIWQTEGKEEHNFNLRGRYQLGIRTPSYDILLKNGIYLLGSIEYFWNIDDDFQVNAANRIRYDVGAGTKISDAWGIQLHYILQDGRRPGEDSFSADEHILRLRLSYQFDKEK